MAIPECRWKCPQQWSEWSEWLAAGLHARNRWRLPILMVGLLFAGGRRTVTTWLRAAGVSDDFQDYYYFLACLGRKSESIATQLGVWPDFMAVLTHGLVRGSNRLTIDGFVRGSPGPSWPVRCQGSSGDLCL